MRINLITGITLLAGLAAAQEISKPELQKKLKDTAVHASWIYDDLPAALETAKASGKPVLALFRCVP